MSKSASVESSSVLETGSGFVLPPQPEKRKIAAKKRRKNENLMLKTVENGMIFVISNLFDSQKTEYYI
jgi:hypothetical protein